MQDVVNYIGCNTSSLHSDATIACLRSFDMMTLWNASAATFTGGDIWLPVIDGDFLPAAPSELLNHGRFANVNAMIGWCQDDFTIATDLSISTVDDTHKFITSSIPDVTSDNVDKLLALYPSAEYQPNPAGFSSEFNRAENIVRDISLVCPSMFLGEKLAKAGGDVYLYDWNQTILDGVMSTVYGRGGFGVTHSSELAYVYGNLSHYNVSWFPFHVTPSDYALQDRGTRSWSSFASTGKPGLVGHDTFVNFTKAFPGGNETYIFIAGGPEEGLSAIDGPKSNPVIQKQRLRERCQFLNSPELIQQLKW